MRRVSKYINMREKSTGFEKYFCWKSMFKFDSNPRLLPHRSHTIEATKYLYFSMASIIFSNKGLAMCHVFAGANYELPSIPLTTFLPTLVRYSLFDDLIIQLLDVETKRCQRNQNCCIRWKIAGKNIEVDKIDRKKSNYTKS